MSNDLVLWESPSGITISKSASVPQAMEHNIQLSTREVKQIEESYSKTFYDMSSEYIWLRAMNLLREKVLSLGIDFVLEMLGRTDRSVAEKLPEFDVINLASELGFINALGKLKLLQANELIQYHSSRNADEEMDKSSADTIIITCVKYILGQNNSNLKFEYNNFRDSLKLKVINENDAIYSMLINSPYFYRRTTVRTLLNLIKQTEGAERQNIFANIQIIIPGIWDTLLSDDKYPIGFAYAEAVNAGNEKVSSVLKSLLLKVKGFDYVPENLRSTTFINAAKNLISVHYSINNFYNEPIATKNLAFLGTTIPTPALGACITAVLLVKLGNCYGIAWDAQSNADDILKGMFDEKWKYYFDNVLIGDEIILMELMTNYNDIKDRWCSFVESYELKNIEFDNLLIKRLISTSLAHDYAGIIYSCKKMYENLNKKSK